jgi:spore coat polysaccharide biosynthesis predicted glycosyltransferase SpsG
MSKIEVELVCDGGPGIGYGHIRRMLTLADELTRAGISSRVTGVSKCAKSLLPLQSYSESSATVVVLDLPFGSDQRIKDARDAGQRVIALDWFGKLEPDIAVVVYPHIDVRARLREYVGLEFQIIRSDIVSAPRLQEGDGVVILLGGGDLLGQGHQAAARLAQLGYRVSLIQGPFASNCASSTQYDVLVNPPDLPKRLAESSWLVTNGGSCMFEAMCLGKAAVVLPQTHAEFNLAKFVFKRGGLLGVGFENLQFQDEIKIRNNAHRAIALVDGRGAERVAAIVETLL